MKIKMWWSDKKPKIVEIESIRDVPETLDKFIGKKQVLDGLNYEVYHDNGQVASY